MERYRSLFNFAVFRYKKPRNIGAGFVNALPIYLACNTKTSAYKPRGERGEGLVCC